MQSAACLARLLQLVVDWQWQQSRGGMRRHCGGCRQCPTCTTDPTAAKLTAPANASCRPDPSEETGISGYPVVGGAPTVSELITRLTSFLLQPILSFYSPCLALVGVSLKSQSRNRNHSLDKHT